MCSELPTSNVIRLLVFILIAVLKANSQTLTWSGAAGDGDLFNPANYHSPSFVPNATTILSITVFSNFIGYIFPNGTGPRTVGSLDLYAPSATFVFPLGSYGITFAHSGYASQVTSITTNGNGGAALIVNSGVSTTWTDTAVPIASTYDINQILIQSGGLIMALNGALTLPQTLSFGDPNVNEVMCPVFVYQIPWPDGTATLQSLNISSLTTHLSASLCSGGQSELMIQPLSASLFKPCAVSCTNISHDCCLLSLTFSGLTNTSRNFQIPYGSAYLFITFDFGVPIYIGNGVTFMLYAYSVALNGNFMLGVGSVLDVEKISNANPLPGFNSSIQIGGTVQSSSGSTLIINIPADIFINATASLISLSLDFTTVAVYVQQGATINNCSLSLSGNLFVPFTSVTALNQLTLLANMNLGGQLQVGQLLGAGYTITVLDQSTLIVTETIQPGVTVNLLTQNSFLAITSPSVNLTIVAVTGLGYPELRNNTFVLPTSGFSIAIGLGATAVINSTATVTRLIVVNGGSITAPFPLTFQAPVILSLNEEDFYFNVPGNTTFSNLTITNVNRNSSVILPSGTVISGPMTLNFSPNFAVTFSGGGVLDLSAGLTIISGYLRINCSVMGITANTFNIGSGGVVEFLETTSLPALTLTGGTFITALTNFSIGTLNWIAGTVGGGGTVNVQNLIPSANGVKILAGTTELIVQQLNLVAGSIATFDPKSTGVLTFQGNLTLTGNTGLNFSSATLINEGTIKLIGNILSCNTLYSGQGFSKKRDVSQYPSFSPPRLSLSNGVIQTGTLTNAGLIDGYGTINGNVINQGQGEIYVGNMTVPPPPGGVLLINGSLIQNGNVTVSIGGMNASSINILAVNGLANLGGWLNVIFDINTTSANPASASYLVATYSNSMNDYSNTAFFNNATTRPAFATTTSHATYVQFYGCYQYSNSCNLCPKTAFDGCVWCSGGNNSFYCSSVAFCPSASQQTCPNELLGLLVIPAALVLGAAIFLIVFFARRAKRVGGGDKALLKRKPGPPDFAPIAFGTYMMESRLNKKDKALIPSLQKLRDLLLQEDMELAIVSCDPKITMNSDVDKVSQAITYIYESAGRFPKLLHELIKREVENTQQDGTLFRANTVTSTSWKFYSKLVGLEYLWNTISDEIYLLIEKTSSGDISTEMDPILLGEEDNIKVNKYQLMLTAQQILSKIIRSVDNMPLAMRVVLHILQEEVTKKFPNSRHTCVGGWIFLRFFNPAINLPEAYGLTRKPPSKEARRVFVLVTKTLQSLANGIKLGGKEQHMARLNDFIDENQEEINQFFDRIATIPEGKSMDDIVPAQIPENVLIVSLVEFHRHLYHNLDKIKEKLSQEKIQQLDAVMQEIGTPIKIGEEETTS
jgi:hypothetical protein